MTLSTRSTILFFMQLSVTLVLLHARTLYAESDEVRLTRELSVQREVETGIKAIIGSQLSEGEYFVYAKVKLRPTPIPAGQNDKPSDDIELPYSPVKVNREALTDLLRKKGETIAEVEELKVTIVFDLRVPKEKVDLLSGVISDRFGFNGKDRSLDIKKIQLVTEPVKQSEKLVFEKTKLDSERATLDLEQARSRLDLAKREAELETAKRILEERKNEMAAEKTPEPEKVEPQKSLIDYLQGFQILLLAIIGGFFAIVLIFLAATSLQKGLRPMADAVNRIGEGFGKLAPVAAGSGGGAMPMAGPSPAADAAGKGDQDDTGADVLAGAMRGEGGAEDKGLEDFLAQISEKLRLLMEQKNFSFYRHFLDMVESDSYRKMAAAILLTIDEKDAKILLENLSSEHIERLKDFLTRPGAMLEARSVSKIALQEFYGRIAAEEFSGSPLYNLSNLSWFTQMTTASMLDFVISLDPDLRLSFLACLTPARVNAMIAQSKDKFKRDEILRSLKALDTVTEAQIEDAMRKIGKLAPGRDSSVDAKPMINTAKYIAQVAANLAPEDRAILMEDLEQNKDLSKKLREYIIPFKTVLILPREMLNELFTGRSDLMIAQILFDAPDEVRAKVLAVLPEIRRENVNSELQVLDDNKMYAKRNRKMSADLQKEITTYLINLYREGLIELDEEALAALESEGNGNAADFGAPGKNVA